MQAQKKKFAIIGTGIAGMGCAYFLHKDFDITVFEQADYIGGHTNTCFVNEGKTTVPVDTGFIVCNEENYPLLMKLFQRLEVPLKKTTMSFAAQIVHDKIEYCGSSLKLLFAQKRNLFSPRFIRFLIQLNKFNSACLEVLDNPEFHSLSVRAYVRKKKWNNDLLNWYLLPMSSALWSTPPETTARFPILALVRFFKNHGFLGLNTQFQWFTVDGGSEEYKKRLIAPFKDRIKIYSEVRQLRRNENSVSVELSDGSVENFDQVVIATHADEALKILGDATENELELLAPFKYEKNTATLHTDESVMPSLKKVWSSWNYRIDKQKDKMVSSCNYWMNSLQNVSENKNYFVSINDPGIIHPEKIIKSISYEHPIFTVEAMKMQKRLPELNEGNQLYFCGSYFRYGFHEDAFMSAVAVCEKILGRDVWS